MTISIHIVRGIIEYLQHSGIDTNRYLEAAEFDKHRLSKPDGRITMEEYDRLQDTALTMSGNPALGLHLWASISSGAIDILGYLVLNCTTVQDAFEVFFRYHHILSDCVTSSLEEYEDTATLIYHYPMSTTRLNQLRGEFGLALILQFRNMFSISEHEILEVGFEHSRPHYAAAYEKVFPCPVHFDQKNTYMTFRRQTLDNIQQYNNPALYRVLSQRAEELVSIHHHGGSFADQIQQLIVQSFDGHKPCMQETAKHFSISDRSLRRKLQQENINFSIVTNRAMETLAKNALAKKNLSIKEISHQMGFNEVSSFHRAFKQWTGLTPTHFRNQL